MNEPRAFLAIVSLLAALACIVFAIATLTVNGVMVLGTIFALVYAWSVGSFERSES